MKLRLPLVASVKDLENEIFEQWKMGRKPKIPSNLPHASLTRSTCAESEIIWRHGYR